VRPNKPETFSATPAPEPPVKRPEAGSAQLSLPRDEDATLPDPPPPELQQTESEAGGGEQVEAADAAPAEDMGKCLILYS
jgi:hypothetical protein